jgi:uncharacterized protein YciI
MLFALNCRDRPGKLQLRLDTRPAHVAHLNELNARGVLKFAGPYLDGDEKPCGSLVVIDAVDAAAAKAIADSDPFAKAGLFETVEIQRWNWAFNNPQTP